MRLYLNLELINLSVKPLNNLILPSQLPFLLFQLVNISLFRPDITFKLHYLLILLCSDRLDHLFLVLTEDIFDLREVGLDYIGHTAETLKQGGDLLVQGSAEKGGDVGFHHADHTLDFFLVGGVKGQEGALELHYGLNNELEMV